MVAEPFGRPGRGPRDGAGRAAPGRIAARSATRSGPSDSNRAEPSRATRSSSASTTRPNGISTSCSAARPARRSSPAARARSSTSESNAVFPIPGSPNSASTALSPFRVRSTAVAATRCSAVRPTNPRAVTRGRLGDGGGYPRCACRPPRPIVRHVTSTSTKGENMARPGEITENPITGERCRWLVTSAETGGRLTRAEFWTRPGGGVPVMHIHREANEHFEVLAGELTARVGHETIVLRPGEHATLRRESRTAGRRRAQNCTSWSRSPRLATSRPESRRSSGWPRGQRPRGRRTTTAPIRSAPPDPAARCLRGLAAAVGAATRARRARTFRALAHGDVSHRQRANPPMKRRERMRTKMTTLACLALAGGALAVPPAEAKTGFGFKTAKFRIQVQGVQTTAWKSEHQIGTAGCESATRAMAPKSCASPRSRSSRWRPATAPTTPAPGWATARRCPRYAREGDPSQQLQAVGEPVHRRRRARGQDPSAAGLRSAIDYRRRGSQVQPRPADGRRPERPRHSAARLPELHGRRHRIPWHALARRQERDRQAAHRAQLFRGSGTRTITVGRRDVYQDPERWHETTLKYTVTLTRISKVTEF